MAHKPVWKLDVGDAAPDFTLPATGDGAGKGGPSGEVSLKQYRGTNVVLAFYPAAFTPVCSAQLPSIEQKLSDFSRRNAQVLGISTDNVYSNEAWAKSMGGLSHPLLSDFWPHGKVAVDYGVLRSGGITERAIFVIDREGIVRYIDIHDLKQQPPIEKILQALDPLV